MKKTVLLFLTTFFLTILVGVIFFFLGFWSGQKHNCSGQQSPNWVRVVRVVDGDTFEITGEIKVRLFGVDTPESVHTRKAVECYGKEAAKRTKELVEGKWVRLENDKNKDHDRYGRPLRYVWLENGTMLDMKLIAEGYARAQRFVPKAKYQLQFLEAEQKAREAREGMWRACQSDS